MGRSVGRAAVLDYQTDGVGGVAGWNTVDTKRDVTVNSEWSEADVSASEIVDTTMPASLSLTFEAQLVSDPDDTHYKALQAAFEAGTSMGFRALSKAATGAGWVFDGVITRWNETKNRKDEQTTSITIKPTPSATAPAWQDAS